jgi:hypothetical protein
LLALKHLRKKKAGKSALANALRKLALRKE